MAGTRASKLAESVRRVRTTRRPRAELEALVLEAARELLQREGLSLGVQGISFQRTFDHLEATRGVKVTHASVTGRIWRDQEHFQFSVIDSVLKLPLPEDPLFAQSLERMLAVVRDADRSSEEGRWAAVVEVCRVGAEDNLKLLQADPWWPMWVSVWAWLATASDSPEREQLRAALLANHAETDAIYTTLFEGITAELGIRPREGFSLRGVDAMLAWAAAGAAMRQRVDPEALAPTQRNGKAWTPLGTAFEAIATLALEPIPDWQPPQR